MDSQKSHLEYRPDIDGLRAIAVLSVVVFHAFPNILPGGFIGVDIFFVISGYLITTILLGDIKDGCFSLKAFYSRRIQRIFPALLLVLITSFGIGWLVLSVGEFAHLGKHIFGGSIFISNLFTWNESGYFDHLAETKPLLHLWSLGIEEQFYIFWPIFLLISFRSRINVLWLLNFFLLASLIYCIFLVKGNSTAAFFSPFSRFWEPLIGSSVACLCMYKKKLVAEFQGNNKDLLALVGIAFICIGLVLLSSQSLFPGLWTLLPTLGAALIILAGDQAWINRRVLSLPFFVWLGLISYPLYLWHWPVLTVARIVTLDAIEPIACLTLLAASVLLAHLTYHLLEKPIRKKFSASYLTPALIFCMLLMGFLGFNTYAREGLPSRKIAINNVETPLVTAFGKSGCLNLLSSDGKILCATAQQLTLSNDNPSPIVFLWGDSHAGHLNYGLLSQSNKLGYQLYDASMPACPPILNFSPRGNKSGAQDENIKCIDHNLNVVREIEAIRPKVVLLAANWMQYDGVHQFNQLPYSELLYTIDKLRSVGVESVVLLGNAPVYYVDQPKLALKLFRAGFENRTYKRFDFRAYDADQKILEYAKDNNIQFVSPIAYLCNDQGCLISTKDDKLNPVAFDQSHFTREGSKYFTQKMIAAGVLKLN